MTKQALAQAYQRLGEAFLAETGSPDAEYARALKVSLISCLFLHAQLYLESALARKAAVLSVMHIMATFC